MAQVHKGKQATRGAKQIVEENRSTLAFYRNMIAGSLISFLVKYLVFEMTTGSVVMSLFTAVVLLICHQFMSFMARPQYSETGSLLDSGNDLNLEGGVAEGIKDMIILSSSTIVLALLSNYFWLLLLLIPARLIWLLTTNVIRPWLNQQPTQEEIEADDKKQRKLERKMRRMR